MATEFGADARVPQTAVMSDLQIVEKSGGDEGADLLRFQISAADRVSVRHAVRNTKL